MLCSSFSVFINTSVLFSKLLKIYRKYKSFLASFVLLLFLFDNFPGFSLILCFIFIIFHPLSLSQSLPVCMFFRLRGGDLFCQFSPQEGAHNVTELHAARQQLMGAKVQFHILSGGGGGGGEKKIPQLPQIILKKGQQK